MPHIAGQAYPILCHHWEDVGWARSASVTSKESRGFRENRTYILPCICGIGGPKSLDSQ